MGWKGIAIASMPLVLAACGASAASSSAPAASPVIVATLPPTALPTLVPAEHIGDTVNTTTGAHVTVAQTAPASSGYAFQSPPAGGSFLAAEIRECAGNQILYVAPSEWSVRLADATQVDGLGAPFQMSPTPALQATDLNPAGCADGWVYFPLPPNAAPKEIHLLKADFYWTL